MSAFAAGLMIGMVILIYTRVTVPAPDASTAYQAAVITYADGEIMARLGPVNREKVALSEVPQPVRDAVIAAEDQNFYSNRGFEASSIARAALSNLRGGSEGGSTITQQYVKNIFNRREHTAKRKVDELFLAAKISRQRSKDEILEGYLNTIYWGRNAFGIQSAAQAYFRCEVEQLTISQGVFLAGIINAPEMADPEDGEAARERARRRWGVVLDAMVANGALAADVAQAQHFPEVRPERRSGALAGQTGYLTTMVEAEARRKLGIDEQEFRTGGYRVVSTFDKGLVEAGVDAVRSELPKKRPRHLTVGMTAIDPRTGAVRALYGGKDFLKRQRNAATQDTVEAAGVFSPFPILAALEMGLPLDRPLDGSSPMKLKDKIIDNFRGRQAGLVHPSVAMAESVNTALAQLNEMVGPARTRDAAYAAGISESAPIGTDVTNALGAVGVHPIDIAAAYATLAGDGVRRTPYVVQSVTRTGPEHVVLDMDEDRTRGSRVFSVASARLVTDWLSVRGLKAGAADSKKRQARFSPSAATIPAVQTGTSPSYRSAWTVGYTRELATAVSIYQLTPDGSNLVRMKGLGKEQHITGDTFPARIWSTFMASPGAGGRANHSG